MFFYHQNKTLWRNSYGAIDLVSIIAGIVIVGIIGSVVGATIFGVIPWVQDKAAKNALLSISQAESTYSGYNKTGNSDTYLTLDDLVANGYVMASNKAKATVNNMNDCFVSVSLSDTGKVFWSDSYTNVIKQYESGAKSLCQDLTVLVAQLSPAVAGPVTTPTVTASTTAQPTTSPTTPVSSSSPTPTSTITPIGGGSLILHWDTSLAGCATAKLPLRSSVDVNVTWGDGTITSNVKTIDPAHTFAAGLGVQQITVDGSFATWVGSLGASSWNPQCVVDITKWAGTGTSDLSFAFSGANNLTNVVGIPSTTTNLASAFANNTKFNADISTWDVSNVTNMAHMFNGATLFNKPLNSWNVSNVLTMSGMFMNTSTFNQPLNSWNVSKVLDMSSMFQSATVYNQNISTWSVNPAVNLTNFRLNSALTLLNSLLFWVLG